MIVPVEGRRARHCSLAGRLPHCRPPLSRLQRRASPYGIVRGADTSLIANAQVTVHQPELARSLCWCDPTLTDGGRYRCQRSRLSTS
jgi:hypothetical protein